MNTENEQTEALRGALPEVRAAQIRYLAAAVEIHRRLISLNAAAFKGIA
ncbi:MAG: hypothetical protein ABJA83_00670 [Burkholderiaceae bacterium]